LRLATGHKDASVFRYLTTELEANSQKLIFRYNEPVHHPLYPAFANARATAAAAAPAA